jgi:hypothetical protein
VFENLFNKTVFENNISVFIFMGLIRVAKTKASISVMMKFDNINNENIPEITISIVK